MLDSWWSLCVFCTSMSISTPLQYYSVIIKRTTVFEKTSCQRQQIKILVLYLRRKKKKSFTSGKPFWWCRETCASKVRHSMKVSSCAILTCKNKTATLLIRNLDCDYTNAATLFISMCHYGSFLLLCVCLNVVGGDVFQALLFSIPFKRNKKQGKKVQFIPQCAKSILFTTFGECLSHILYKKFHGCGMNLQKTEFLILPNHCTFIYLFIFYIYPGYWFEGI